MAKVTGIGGIFFKTDTDATRAWFNEALGLKIEPWGAVFRWRDHEKPETEGATALSLFARDTDHFGSNSRDFMLNLRVDDLDGMLASLRTHGIEILKVLEPSEYGKFAQIRGPDGVTIELWEPAANDSTTP